MPFIWYRSFEAARSSTHEAMEYSNEDEPLTTDGQWDLYSLKKSQKFMIKAALIVGGGGMCFAYQVTKLIFGIGFIYGYDIGVISGALSQLEGKFNLSSIEAGLVVACLPLGSMFGCVVGGPFCDRFGRSCGQIILFPFLR